MKILTAFLLMLHRGKKMLIKISFHSHVRLRSSERKKCFYDDASRIVGVSLAVARETEQTNGKHFHGGFSARCKQDRSPENLSNDNLERGDET